MKYLGDIKLGDTLDFKFTSTTAATGVPTTLAGSPVISAYVGNSTTEITAGITLTVDFDTRTGLNHVRVVASAGNGFAAGTNVQMIITTGTVGGASAVSYDVAEFSIENRVVNIASMPVMTGAYPALGISDSGTAQAAGALTFTIRSAATFADNSLTGKVILITSGTSIGETATILSNVGSTDVCTLAGTSTGWSGGVTPSGTPNYAIFDRAPDAGIAAALLTIAKLEAAFASSGVFSAGALANTPAGTFIRSSTVTGTGGFSNFTDSTITELGVNALRGYSIRWTGGANVGRPCRINASTGTAVSTTPPMPNAITMGDTYRLYHDAEQLLTTEAVASIFDFVVEGTTSFVQSIRLCNAAIAGKSSGLGTGLAVFRDLADTKDRITVTSDAQGNRLGITRDVN